MPHPEADLDALSAQLRDGRVAFGTDNPANESLAADLTRAMGNIDAAGAADVGDIGVVVLETTPERPGDLRDIAQDLQNVTGLDTVVVRTPNSAAAVSNSLSRAEIESGQLAMVGEPDYAVGLEAFAAEADGFAPPWVVVFLVLAAIVAVVVLMTFFSVVRQRR
ncbi:hypothetical protein KBX17_04855 [Corynebacterium sp. CCUG 65737]|uniref:Rv1476 family membrane protein n=1 Tax=Corynebacterium sp. CCUG 65737 TaxID=2823889 RepID=UPI00210A8B31|nr:DUF6676 family protein [Corynebacterium sp. CCUG 65737]MCQ4627140.1 hypothetical protein [Corynebacterium sp. CCUG 65737]